MYQGTSDEEQSTLPKDPPSPNEKLEYVTSKGPSSSQIPSLPVLS